MTERVQLPVWLTAISPSHFAAVSLAVASVAISAIAGAGLEPSGDGALHVNLATQIATLGSLDTSVASHYPPFYHLLGAIGYIIAGPSGVQAISFVAFGLTSIFTYMFARELTGSEKAAIAAQALVTFSPVMLWYSSLTLMEPTLTAAVMAALYFVLKASNDASTRNVLIAAVGLTVVALTKQTGLPVVAAALVYFLVTGYGIKRTTLIAGIVVAASAGPYLFVYSQTGAFTDPGQLPVSEILEQDDSFPGSIMTGGIIDQVEPWSRELDLEIDGADLYSRGTVLHEARHVYWRNLIQWNRFEWIHTLYPASFNGYEGPSFKPFHWLISLSLITGLGAAFYAISRSRGWLFVLLVLGASYVAMSWGTDTKRLFLYVPVVASVLVVLPYLLLQPELARLLRTRLSRNDLAKVVNPTAAMFASLIMLFSVAPLLSAQFGTVEDSESTQGGGFDSVGGINSIAETGTWLNANLGESDSFVAASVYEWEYYSNRQDLWDEGLDYRAYFLPSDRIDYYLRQAGAKFVVIRQNQIVDDSDWNHIELIPASFVESLEANYEVTYTSIYGDIRVFEIPQISGELSVQFRSSRSTEPTGQNAGTRSARAF